MKKQKSPKGAKGAVTPQEAITDPRFVSFTTDPRFRLPSKKYTRTKIDKRFARMLKDDEFSSTAKVDHYGRKLSSNKKKQALERLYRGEEEDDDDEDDDGEEYEKGSGERSDIEVEDDEVVEKELRRADANTKANYDPARGGGFSSSDDDDDDGEEDGGVEVEEVAEFPDRQLEQAGVPMGEVTARIAVVNLDWDNIRAVDLMAVFSSFLRGAGRIEKISVYKSEFGKERMEREEMEGPPREIFAKKGGVDDAIDEEDEDSEDESEGSEEEEEEDEDKVDEQIKKDLLKEDDGQEVDSAALRQYQLERLRYYYAVIVCSDKETANHIYEATDGAEYLSSANFFDLRFIPNDVEFDDKPKDECHSLPSKYRPTEFVTDALQHSKVKLTWDAEDTERKEAIKRVFSGSRAEIGENDLRAYLGSDSSDDEDEEVNGEDGTDAPKLTKKELARQKMRAALGLSDEPSSSTSKVDKAGPVGDMEITFTAGLSSKAKSGVFENEPIKEETTAEAYIRKEKERKARRKEKAKAIREGRDPNAISDSADAEAQPPPQEEKPFDDPFFTTDEAAKAKASKKLRKEERRAKREAKAAEAAARASERAALELLMADNSTSSAAADHLDHFDINEIARVEKEARRKKKHQRSKRSNRETADGGSDSGKRGGLQAGFEMDVMDPRFAAVFEKHEFAIDPTNPKFKGTEGMRKLLEEGRKRQSFRKGDEMDGEGRGSLEKEKKKERKVDQVNGKLIGKRKAERTDVGTNSSGELKGLVECVKKKVRR